MYNQYQTFGPDVVGAAKFFVSGINSLDDVEDVKLSKRLNLPSSKLRGFAFGKIGPKDGDDYIGGNYAYSLNLETNLPNLLPEATKTESGTGVGSTCMREVNSVGSISVYSKRFLVKQA